MRTLSLLRCLWMFGLSLTLTTGLVLAKDGGHDGPGNVDTSGKDRGDNNDANPGENKGKDDPGPNNGKDNKGNDSPEQDNHQQNGRGNHPPPSASAPPSRPGAGLTPDQDQALAAVEQARALPLETVTAKIHETTPGDIIDARLVTVDGFLLYEVKVLQGQRLEVLYYYARSGIRVGG